jgi:hypothetical protein
MFDADVRILKRCVQASMKGRQYDVHVSNTKCCYIFVLIIVYVDR